MNKQWIIDWREPKIQVIVLTDEYWLCFFVLWAFYIKYCTQLTCWKGLRFSNFFPTLLLLRTLIAASILNSWFYCGCYLFKAPCSQTLLLSDRLEICSLWYFGPNSNILLNVWASSKGVGWFYTFYWKPMTSIYRKQCFQVVIQQTYFETQDFSFFKSQRCLPRSVLSSQTLLIKPLCVFVAILGNLLSNQRWLMQLFLQLAVSAWPNPSLSVLHSRDLIFQCWVLGYKHTRGGMCECRILWRCTQ